VSSFLLRPQQCNRAAEAAAMGEVSAMKCNNIREMSALDQTIEDTDVQAHVDT